MAMPHFIGVLISAVEVEAGTPAQKQARLQQVAGCTPSSRYTHTHTHTHHTHAHTHAHTHGRTHPRPHTSRQPPLARWRCLGLG